MGDALSQTPSRIDTDARALWGFAPYAAMTLVHVSALAFDVQPLAGSTKLLLMPALALAVVWALRDIPFSRASALLLVAIAFSWIGDGAATLVPFAPELPVMLAAFGVAHVAYIWVFVREVPARRVPAWTLGYVAWWIVLLVVLWPHLGALAVAVSAYGLVLAGTAATSARVSGLVAVGGALFLASDTVLAFRLFLPDAMPAWTSPLVMITYTLGQGLIALGVVRALRARAAR